MRVAADMRAEFWSVSAKTGQSWGVVVGGEQSSDLCSVCWIIQSISVVCVEGDGFALAWPCVLFPGEYVQDLFFRITALAFEDSVLQDLERAGSPSGIGAEGLISKWGGCTDIQVGGIIREGGGEGGRAPITLQPDTLKRGTDRIEMAADE